MHDEAYLFVMRVRSKYPGGFLNVRVLDFGSLNVNGTVRHLFTACDYVGVDAHPGKGVDIVCPAHQYRGSAADIFISTEMFEHDPYLKETIANGFQHLHPGGLFVFTCAGPARAEHGTRRTEDPGGIWGPDPDFYRNVSMSYMAQLLEKHSVDFRLEYARGAQDLYGFGFKK